MRSERERPSAGGARPRSRRLANPSEASLTPIASVFLDRLQRLIRIRREYQDDLNPLGLRLLGRAIDATFIDCVDYEASTPALEIMKAHRYPERERAA